MTSPHNLPMSSSLLYLGTGDIQALRLPPRAVADAVAAQFAAHAAGGLTVKPKQTLQFDRGHFFQSLSVAAPSQGYAITKWVGIASNNTAKGLANVNGTLLLSDVETGLPLAVMDAGMLTVLRTAAMSAVAARALARVDSRSIGFVGCGQQAAGHLEALRDALPGLETVVALSAQRAQAQQFSEHAQQKGLRAQASGDPAEVLACDVIVSTVPASPDLQPFLDAAQVRAGAFVSAVDLGRSWLAEGLQGFDIKATDDIAQAEDPENRKKIAYKGPFDTDLAGLVSTDRHHRASSQQRTLFLFPGFSAGDLAIGVLAYQTALASGIGIRLPR